MSRSVKIFSVLVLLAATTYSCTKTGATGATGATGTANVLYSAWAPLSMTYNEADSMYEQTIQADSLTQAVLDSGLVLSYIKYTNTAGATQVESAGTFMREILGLKSIALYSYYYDLTDVPYRYIIIHGGAAAGNRLAAGTQPLLQGHTKEEWQAMRYEQVVSLLGE